MGDIATTELGSVEAGVSVDIAGTVIANGGAASGLVVVVPETFSEVTIDGETVEDGDSISLPPNSAAEFSAVFVVPEGEFSELLYFEHNGETYGWRITGTGTSPYVFGWTVDGSDYSAVGPVIDLGALTQFSVALAFNFTDPNGAPYPNPVRVSVSDSLPIVWGESNTDELDSLSTGSHTILLTRDVGDGGSLQISVIDDVTMESLGFIALTWTASAIRTVEWSPTVVDFGGVKAGDTKGASVQLLLVGSLTPAEAIVLAFDATKGLGPIFVETASATLPGPRSADAFDVSIVLNVPAGAQPGQTGDYVNVLIAGEVPGGTPTLSVSWTVEP